MTATKKKLSKDPKAVAARARRAAKKAPPPTPTPEHPPVPDVGNGMAAASEIGQLMTAMDHAADHYLKHASHLRDHREQGELDVASAEARIGNGARKQAVDDLVMRLTARPGRTVLVIV